MIELSVSSCWTSRPRLAPTDRRTAISSCRLDAARQQEVRDVGAGDQQHQPKGYEHDGRHAEDVRRATGSDSAVAGATVNAVVRPGCC